MDEIPDYELSDQVGHDVPLTSRNWLPVWQLEMGYNTSILTGHLSSSHRTACGLEQIVKAAKDFDQLKSELLKFIQERKDFVKDAEDKWDGPNPERWGFPT